MTDNYRLHGPPEAGEESAALRHRVSLALPAGVRAAVEADGAARKEQENKRSECHPETGAASGVGAFIEVIEFLLDTNKESNVNCESDQGNQGGEEAPQGREQLNGEMTRKSEEKSDQGHGSRDRGGRGTASP